MDVMSILKDEQGGLQEEEKVRQRVEAFTHLDVGKGPTQLNVMKDKILGQRIEPAFCDVRLPHDQFPPPTAAFTLCMYQIKPSAQRRVLSDSSCSFKKYLEGFTILINYGRLYQNRENWRRYLWSCI
ncbi:Protein Phosphatase 1 Regulatory Subunit 3D [Manis pentadactyla]|nr:Protein Phosphatase 1 Regulatory Subunit 3D [Manis pentadactyla]